MGTALGARTMTADELLRRPEDHKRHELIEGRLTTMEPAGAEHGRVAMRVASRLAHHVEKHGLGEAFAAETGFVLATGPDTVRAPDAAFIARERVERTGRVPGFWPGAPDLAVEVLSPGDAFTEVQEKALGWLDAGSHAVVALDPRRRTATVYRSPADIRVLTEDEVLDVGDVVAGFSVVVRELFG